MDSSGGNDMSVKLVSNQKIAETSSKGNQEKWLDNGKWYKLDQFGYEALAETFSSMLPSSASSSSVVNSASHSE